jgi:2-hydroxy-6-oxonona-2,4-dienedioate hydrolase
VLVAIVPAAFAPGRNPQQPPNALARAIIEYGLRSVPLFWSGMTVSEEADRRPTRHIRAPTLALSL